MKKWIILFIIILAIIIGILFYSYEENQKDKEFITLYGNIDVRQVDLGFRVSGRVNTLLFEEGDLVQKGSLMATLDKQPYLDLIKQAEASLESTITSLKNADQILKRRQELISDGSISQEDLDIAHTNRNVFVATKAENEAALSVAKLNLEFTEVFAPTDGTILTRIREPGTVVNPAEPVYTLSVINPVWVRAYVNEPELGLVYPGMPAEIFTDTQNGKVYEGHVGFISPVAEFTPKTVETTQLRTDLVYRLRIYAKNPDKGLRQGMPVSVKLRLHKEPQ